MYFIPYYTYLEEPLTKNAKSITMATSNNFALPEGNYFLLESYCMEQDCDCRKVMINAVSAKDLNTILATIHFGWEDVDFYKKWLHGDCELAREMAGFYLEVGGRQSEYAHNFLKLVKETIARDKKYLETIKEHYQQFKTQLQADDRFKFEQPKVHVVKIGRNDPCVCGSGKKYKKCCLNNNRGTTRTV